MISSWTRRQRTRRSTQMIWRQWSRSLTSKISVSKWKGIGNTIKCNPIMHFEGLNQIGIVQKQGIWLPHELTDREVERRKNISEQIKTFIHLVVTGDQKWIDYDNPKWSKTWICSDNSGSSKPKHSGLYCIYGYTRRTRYILSDWNYLRLSKVIIIVNKSLNWIEL